MPDGPVLTTSPRDRLGSLADAMTETLGRIPGTADVRAMVMLTEGGDGCVRPYGYPDPEGRPSALLFVDAVLHLRQMGLGLGLEVDVVVSGEKVPSPGPEVGRG